MQSENICRLCLLSNNNIIKFSSEEGVNLQISNIVSKHFWFEIHQNDGLPHAVCRQCWSNTKEFHEFYNSIEITHKSLNGTLLNSDSLKSEDDCKFKCDANSHGRDYNNTISETTQHNANSSVNLIKSEVIEDIADANFYDENDRFEIANQPTCDFIGKEIVKDKKQLKNEKQINSNKKKIHKGNVKTSPKSIKVNTKNIGKIKSIRTIVKEEIQENIEDPVDNILIKIDNENYVNTNDSILDSSDEPDVIIAEENQKNDAILKRDAEDIRLREFFNLKCQLCSNAVIHLTFAEVKTHYRTVHNMKRSGGYVMCCKKKLFKRCELLEHMHWHLNPDEFRCSICNKLYRDRYGLKLHMNFHISPENRNFACDICGKRFSLKYHLKQHFTLTHIANQNKIYKCNECDKCFGLKSVLQSHIRGVHQFQNTHICHICAKVFKSKLQCDIHSSEHFNVEKVQCQLCGALLKNKHSLKSHVSRTHNQKPIECKYCGKISANKQALQSHVKYIHEGLRLHKCNLCDKTFKKPLNLREHMAGHTGSVLYTCLYCPKTFNSNANMHSHKKRAHLTEWQEERNKRNGISHFN